MAQREQQVGLDVPDPGTKTGLLEQWFSDLGWSPFAFQHEVWQAYAAGESGLIHSATGTGKTYAAWLAPVLEGLADPPGQGLRVLWITPLRALAADTVEALRKPLEALGSNWQVQPRTADTSSSVRAKMAKLLPEGLVTTPESLSLMLGREDASKVFADLQCVIVDEWHELMASKRGVQTELCLARLRNLAPDLRIWGVSATLGNLDEALDILLGGAPGRLVRGDIPKEIIIDSILVPTIQRFPWAGHLGVQMVPLVVEEVEKAETSLVFCNTRSQTELWYQAFLEARPEWKDQIGVHHGSIDPQERAAVEEGLRSGLMRAVICTSSLDLGVDFSPVERVFQVGSSKSVARLLQRAGRSGHRPGIASRITSVPTNAIEYADVAAARVAAFAGVMETREGLHKPLDVLAQHLVTIGLGEGFRAAPMLAEVRSTYAYRDLSDAEWEWTLDFLTRGGNTLRAYPEYHRVHEENGLYRVTDPQVARRHRMSVGTIVSDAEMTVQYLKGGRLGQVEESFLGRLKKGDRFIFAGRILEFVRIQGMTAWVRRATKIVGAVPRWMGGRLALSGELARSIRHQLDLAKDGLLESEEMRLLGPLLATQAKWSAVPAEDELLIETVKTREGYHAFIFPIEGRLVHEGLAALFAYRLSKFGPITFSMACNDYGFELLSDKEPPIDLALEQGLLSRDNLYEDILSSLNAAEMAKRQFREIARIAGLVFPGYPGQPKTARQIQASTGLLYDVFTKYDPENPLLAQAEREVLEKQLEQTRLSRTLERLSTAKVVRTRPPKPTPLAFPIFADMLRSGLTTEPIEERIEKLALRYEKEASE